MIAEFITENVGLPQEIWQKNRDMVYLFDCAVNYRKDRAGYAKNILQIIRPRLKTPGAFGELENIIKNLVTRSEAENKPDTDLFIAQAIEIVANDYWLIDEMIAGGALPEAISAIKSNIAEDAIDVGRRLLRNARRKVQAIYLSKAPLDENRVRPLGELLKNDQQLSCELKLPDNVKRIHLIINAGRSTRVRTTIPKGIIYLAGKPLIQHTIDAGRKAGCDTTVVVLGFKQEINEMFLDKSIHTITQPTVEGTAHAVMCAYPALQNFQGTLLVSYSDMPFILAETLEKLIEKHESGKTVMSILTTSRERRPEFGRLVKDEKGHYLRIAQVRIEETESDQVDAGFYCFCCPDFWPFLKQIENKNNRYEYYLTDILNKISAAGNPIAGYETMDEIETFGINRPDELTKAFEIAYFVCESGNSHNHYLRSFKNASPEFLEDLKQFYEFFGIPDKEGLSCIKLINKINDTLAGQIGAIFYLQ